MKKDPTLLSRLQELKLKLIEVRTLLNVAPMKPVEDFKVAMGYVPEGYRTQGELEVEQKILQEQIAFLEGEIAKAGKTQKNGGPTGKREHEKVKAEVERIQKIRPQEKIEKILDEVAEFLEKSFEATKKAYYYKPKK